MSICYSIPNIYRVHFLFQFIDLACKEEKISQRILGRTPDHSQLRKLSCDSQLNRYRVCHMMIKVKHLRFFYFTLKIGFH